MRKFSPMEVTYELDRKNSALVVSEFKFEVLEGPDQTLSAASSESKFHIGTAEGNQLRLSDTTVSKHHCSVEIGENGLLLRDHESTNGTFINGTRVREAYLKFGDVFRVGASEIRVSTTRTNVSKPLSKRPCFGNVFGSSVAMRRIFELLPKLAAADATVLLTGETGTGKSLIAKALHGASDRKKQPFITLDCGAIPPTLVESELFGHEKGAFTGADSSRAGAFEAADGGTLFLDEIGELPMDLQPKLLSVLEERQIRRVGTTETRKVNFRLVAATNRDLCAAVNRGSFRADLYYRVNTIALEVPPLRKRRGDIPLLVEHFHNELTGEAPPKELTEELSRGDWPGNVRELRSAVERAVVLGDAELWRAMNEDRRTPVGNGEESDDNIDLDVAFKVAKDQAVKNWEALYLKRLMEKHGGNLAQAARAAQMDRRHLRLLLGRHNIDR